MDASLAGRAENASSDVAQSVRSAPAAASFFMEGVQPWQDCTCPLPSDRLQALITGLQQIVPEGSVLYRQEDLRPYECDGLSAYRQLPPVVVLPSTEEQVRQIILLCRRLEVPLVPRGAGTGLTGSAMPHAGGVLMSMARFNQILSLDAHARTARVQPGVRNLAISEAASAFGLFYAPDPSSQIACTIGGNVAENSGGVHCLKYGLTVHNVLAVRGFTIDGEPITLGGTLPGSASAPAATTESVALDTPGLDLLGACIGSEGMLMVVTEVVVKLLPTPRLARVIMASFDDVETAGNAVAPDNLQNFYGRYYRPDNAVLIITGQFDVNGTLVAVQKAFGSIPRPKTPIVQPYTLDPAQQGEREVVVRRTGGVPLLLAGYHTPAGAARDTVALSLLAEMLTREPDGPLYQQLVKPGYAVNVGASSSDLYDPGMLLFSATLASEDKRQIVWDTLRKVVEGELPLSQEALNRTKQDVKNSMQRLAEGSPMGPFLRYLARLVDAQHAALDAVESLLKEMEWNH